jgi:hypothetical protein
VSEEVVDAERVALVPFVESLKGSPFLAAHKSGIRVTPKGLFIEESLVKYLLTTYQSWIAVESKGVAQKTLEKCHQRLFQGEQPERQYLVEGKVVLVGFLVPIPIKSPQQIGLPFYLGSLLSTKSYLHPADPTLKEIKGLQLRHEKSGLEAGVKRGDKELIVTEGVIKSFQKLAIGSRYLQKLFPDITTSLATALRAVVGIIRRSRPVKDSFPMVIPLEVKQNKRKTVRVSGKFLLIEEKGRILKIIELNGRNLSYFLKEELKIAPREALGSLKLTPRERDILGFYENRGKRTAIHSRALAEFCERIVRARDPREKFAGWFTAGQCFERFASTYQLSQPIEKQKIESVLKAAQVNPYSCRLNGGWIFVVTKDWIVSRTLCKHIRLPGQRRIRT